MGMVTLLMRANTSNSSVPQSKQHQHILWIFLERVICWERRAEKVCLVMYLWVKNFLVLAFSPRNSIFVHYICIACPPCLTLCGPPPSFLKCDVINGWILATKFLISPMVLQFFFNHIVLGLNKVWLGDAKITGE